MYTAAEAGCPGGTGTCSVPSIVVLTAGAGQWWVQTGNDAGSSQLSAVLSFSVLGTATLVAPSGSIATQTPTYTWNAVAQATQYLLWVDDASGGRIRNTYTTAQVGCAGGTGTCSVTPSVVLVPGAAQWFIIASNSAGSGPWSLGMGFTVPGAPPPPAATLISPSGSIGTQTPAFVWNAVSAATHYLLWLDDSSGGRLRQTYTAAQVGCETGTGTCTVTPNLVLTPGNGIWWIVTSNASGSGPWSAGMPFTVPGPPPPPAATLVSPSGGIATQTPVFTWNAVATATHYLLWLDDSSGGRLRQTYTAEQTACGGGTGTCTVAPNLVLTPGEGQWWIVTSNASGNGPWSARMAFTVAGPPPPPAATLVSPSGSIATQTPAFTWNAVATATHYLLWLDDSSGGRLRQTYTAAQAGCESGTGTCTVAPNLVLNPGNGTWWIVSGNASGNGPWSAAMPFTVPGPPPPSAASPIAPVGALTMSIPTFTWAPASTATHYLVWLDDSSGGRLRQTYTAEEVGCTGGTGTCSLAPNLALTPGNGMWWVVSGNASGNGPWSPGMPFWVPVVANLMDPGGSITTTTPVFTWTAVTEAIEYKLFVDDATGPRIRNLYTATQADCVTGTGTCAVAPNLVLAAGPAVWWVEAFNVSGEFSTSADKEFAVPVAATLVMPSGTVATPTPTFTWNAVAQASQYLLWVEDSSGGRVRQTFSPAQTDCPSGSGTCSATPDVVLTAGASRWWIASTDTAGNGPRSTEASFLVPAQPGFLDLEWDVPTTNADGSTLRDLLGYRVYAGAAGAACPNANFQGHATPVQDPGPGTKFQATLTNLTPGATYFVRISAVDFSGNESACTPEIGLVARADLTGIPALLNFGNVSVGVASTLDLTVQNVSEATVTGTVTTDAPFSVIAGAAVNLAPSASQVVTVQFLPVTAQTVTFNMRFNPSAGGSRIVSSVSGTGVPL
jgi:hypothetical protein